MRRYFLLKDIIAFLIEVMWKTDTLFMEFWTAFYTICSGVLFMINQIGSYYTGSSYSIISYFIPQFWWGLFMLTIGLLEITGMYSNRYHFQRWILAFATGFWSFTAAIVGFGNNQTWLFVTIIFISVAHIWLYLRISRKLRVRQDVRASLDVL